MKTPIMHFTSDEQVEKCLKWWKKKLFLTDWIIHWRIAPFSEYPLESLYMGHTDIDYVNKCAMVTLADQCTLPQDSIMVLCDEKVLVHELLHLVYPSYTKDSYEAFALENVEHSRLEQMAKSLIMVKYDLPFKWFDNQFKKGEKDSGKQSEST